MDDLNQSIDEEIDLNAEDDPTPPLNGLEQEKPQQQQQQSLFDSPEPKAATLDLTSSPIEHSAILPTSPVAKLDPEVSTTNVASSTPTKVHTTNGEKSPSSDQFIEIKVEEPKKVGDGMKAYVVYRVTTKTNLPYFRRTSFGVNRRFSDFRGLHDKLTEKHLHIGRIIPPAPEKDAVATAKVKYAKEEVGADDFIEKRRSSLERYLNRTAKHPTLRADPDFREFLELDTDLPKANNTSALSGAGVRRLFNRVGDTVNKMTFRMDESDTVSCAARSLAIRRLHVFLFICALLPILSSLVALADSFESCLFHRGNSNCLCFM